MLARVLPGVLLLALDPLPAAQGIKLNEPLARPIGGDVEDFRVTPDGSRAVYVGDQETDGVFELFSAPTDGSQAWVKLSPPLPAGAEVEPGPMLSSDGARVVFEVSDDFGLEELWSAPVDGSAPAVLVVAAGGSGFMLSPDGNHVLVLDDLLTPGVFELFRVPIDGSAAPARLNGPLVSGGDVRHLFGSVEPFATSPDGVWVVYLADQDVAGRPEVYSVPLDGSLPPVKLNGPLVAGGQVKNGSSVPVSVSPDGTRVVYRADQEVDERFELYGAPIDGSAAPVKLNGPLIAAGDVLGASFPLAPDFRVTRDGTRVVYRADQTADGVFAVFVAPIDGSGPAVALSADGPGVRSVVEYDVSPDSSRLVFVSDARTAQVFELFAVPLDASRPPVRLNSPLAAGGDVTSGGSETSFQVSADSRWVVYRADQEVDGDFEVFRVPLSGRGFVRRADGSAPPFVPVKLNPPLEPGWDAYGFEIHAEHVLLQVNGGLFSVPIDTAGPALQLDDATTGGSCLYGPGLEIAANAPIVVYCDSETETVGELYAVPLDGSTPAVKVNGDLPLGPVLGDVFQFAFSPDSRWIVYWGDGDTDEVGELYSVPTTGGGRARKLNSPSGPVSPLFAIDPGSTRVLHHRDGELFIVPIDASASPLRLNGPLVAGGSVSMFDFSPDSSRVVYRADQDTDNLNELYSVPSDGSSAPIKLNPPYTAGHSLLTFAITPDGSRVVYIATQDTPGQKELYSVPIDGSASSVKLNAPLAASDLVELRVTPDGLRVLYRASLSGLHDLYSAPTDGSLPAVLVSGPLASGSLDVFEISPDSARVVYRDPSFFSPSIQSAPVDGSAPPVTLSPPLGAGNSPSAPRVSADSTVVLFAAGSPSQLLRAPIDGSAPAVQLNGAGGSAYSFELTPDGATVVYWGSEPGLDTGILRVPADGSGPVVRLSPAIAVDTYVQLELTADGGEVVYLTSPISGATELHTVPVDGSRAPRFLHRPFGPAGGVQNDIDGPSFRVGADSSRVVYRAHLDGARVTELFLSLLERDALPAEDP